MTFHYGTTRFVFCIGGVAIKVARVKLLYWMLRVGSRILLAHKEGVALTIAPSAEPFARFKHLFAGVTANLQELDMCVKYPHLPVAPTLFSFFGLVNIQVRGTPIHETELPLCPFREYAEATAVGITLNQPENFGRLNGDIVLLDCGYAGLNALLSEHAQSSVAYY